MPRRHRGSTQRRATAQAARAGTEIREARLLHGMTLRGLALRAGVAASTIARIESGDAGVRLDTLCVIAGAAGLDIVVKAYPSNAPRLRDSGQLGIAHDLVRMAHPSWRSALEVPAGDHGRSADLVFFCATEILHIEIERAAVDLQAQLRAALAKREFLASRHERPIRLIIAVSDTTRNRRMMLPVASLLQGTLPTGSREILASFRTGRPLGAHGLLWVRRRAIASRPAESKSGGMTHLSVRNAP